MKGKNFSGNNIGQRKKSDFYETPFSLTRQFLDIDSYHWDKEKPIVEPACGNKAIVKILNEKGFKTVHYYDLQDGTDFLKEEKTYPQLITNPPYSLAMQFILKAKQVATEQFAMLLPLSYLHGVKRYTEIYQDGTYPLDRIYVFTRYPMLGEELREDGKYHTGMMVYAWYVWSNKKRDVFGTPEPRIRWIDNQQYVLKKNDRNKEI